MDSDFPSTGLVDGKNVDVADAGYLGVNAWKDVTAKTIARCWCKANILPTVMQSYVERLFGKAGKPQELDDLSERLRGLALSIPSDVDDADMQEVAAAGRSYGAVKRWQNLEQDEEIQVALAIDILSKEPVHFSRDTVGSRIQLDEPPTIIETPSLFISSHHVDFIERRLGWRNGERVGSLGYSYELHCSKEVVMVFAANARPAGSRPMANSVERVKQQSR